MQKRTIAEYTDLISSGASLLLIKEFLEIDDGINLDRLLKFAVICNRKDVVALVLQLGANLNARDSSGCSALHYAVADEEHSDILKYLIQVKATFLPDNDGNTPLHYALRNPESNVLLTLLECYHAKLDDIHFSVISEIIINKTLPDNVRYAAYLYLLTKGSSKQIMSLVNEMDFTYKNSMHEDALMILERFGRWNLILNLELLSLAKPNIEKGTFYAISHGEKQLLLFLIKLSINGGYKLSLVNENGMQEEPVLTAVRFGQRKILSLLVKPINRGGCGLSLNVKNCRGDDPILVAIEHGQAEILSLLVKPIHEGGYGLSLDVKDHKGNCPVMQAAYFGQHMLLEQLIKSKNEGGYGLSLNVNNSFGSNPMLMSIAGGHIALLAWLLTPESEGGCGLSLDVVCQHGRGPVLTAIYNGKANILSWLVKPKNEGGFGLTFNVTDRKCRGPIETAVFGKEKEMFLDLIKPKTQGGYELPIFEIDKLTSLAYKNNDILLVVVVAYFNQLLNESGIEHALEWVKRFGDFNAIKIELIKEISIYCKKLIQANIEVEEHSMALMIAETLETIYPDVGIILLADSYHEYGFPDAAFQVYLLLFLNSNSIHCQLAGFMLASLIITGEVVLDVQGALDERKTFTQLGLDSLARNKQGVSQRVMMKRAIKAYEYLFSDNSDAAARLRHRLKSIIANNLFFNDVMEPIWSAYAMMEFCKYYRKKNASIFKTTCFKNSVDSFLTQYIDVQCTSQQDEFDLRALSIMLKIKIYAKKGELPMFVVLSDDGLPDFYNTKFDLINMCILNAEKKFPGITADVIEKIGLDYFSMRFSLGNTIMHECILRQFSHLLNYLLKQEKGRELISIINYDGQTPLTLACLHHNIPAIYALFDYNEVMCYMNSIVDDTSLGHKIIESGMALKNPNLFLGNNFDESYRDAKNKSYLHLMCEQDPIPEQAITFIIYQHPFLIATLPKSILMKCLSHGSTALVKDFIFLAKDIPKIHLNVELKQCVKLKFEIEKAVYTWNHAKLLYLTNRYHANPDFKSIIYIIANDDTHYPFLSDQQRQELMTLITKKIENPNAYNALSENDFYKL